MSARGWGEEEWQYLLVSMEFLSEVMKMACEFSQFVTVPKMNCITLKCEILWHVNYILNIFMHTDICQQTSNRVAV